MPAQGGRAQGFRRSDRGAGAAPSEAPVASTPTSTHDVHGWQEVGGKPRHHPGARKQQQQQQQQRVSTKPQAKRAAVVVGTRGGGVGDNNGSSRQQPARSASRREYTLFDHLLTTTASGTPSSRRSGVGWSLGDAGGVGASQPPAPAAAAAAASSEAPAKKPQRRPAPQQARQGTPASGGRGNIAQQVPLGAGRVALLGGGGGGGGGIEGGRFKNAGPSPSSSARQVVIKSSDAPKPGKQRLGPRKKKLSTLKKKILLDRLERWRAIQGEGPPASAPARVGEQGVRPSSLLLHFEEEEAPASLLPPAGRPCGGDDFGDHSAGASGDVGGGQQTRMCVVAIYNLVDDEDVEDCDDHAEIERDLWEMASTFGVVRSVAVPRGAVRLGGAGGTGGTGGLPAAKVVFANATEARYAKRGFHGRIVGGKALRVELEDSDSDSVGGDTSTTGGSPDAPAGGLVWRVAVENLIDEEDDLDDEDEYAEVCGDISAMMGVHGTLIEVDIPRGRLGKESDKGVAGHTDDGPTSTDDTAAAVAAAAGGRLVVATFGSLAEADVCVKDLNGRRVGGKELNAKLVVGRPKVGPASRGDTETAAGCEGTPKRTGLAATATSSLSAAAKATASGGASHSETWRVVIRNLIDEDDLIDDDDYGEVLSDATALVSAYGAAIGLRIPRNPDAAGEEGAADTRDDGAEPGEAVAAFGSLEEAEVCARGLSGRTIAGKVLHAHVAEMPRSPSQPGVIASAAAGPGNNGPLSKQPSAGKTPPQGGWPSVTPYGRSSGPGVVLGVEPPAAGAGAGVVTKPSGGVAAAASITGGKRMPKKYKEAAALPKPSGASGGGSPHAYVCQAPDKEINDLVFEMLQLLFKFQERARLADPAKSKTRRRIVMGLREVLRGVKAKKVRLLIVAPNVDAVGGEGGLDEKVVEIIDVAREGGTPVVFALSKRKIGKALGKTIKVSAVGVYSFDGAHEQQKQLKRRMEAILSLPEQAPLDCDPA